MNSHAFFASSVVWVCVVGCSGTENSTSGSTSVGGSFKGPGGTNTAQSIGGSAPTLGGSTAVSTGGLQSFGGVTGTGSATALGGTQASGGKTSVPNGGSLTVAGGTANSGGLRNSGGTSSNVGGGMPTGGSRALGGASLGGRSSSGGSQVTAGATTTGGTPSTGGASSTRLTTGGSTSPGACDTGTTTTTWASSCPTSAQSCTAGDWVEDGPDPDHSGFKKCSASTHFVVYSDEACTSTADSAVAHLETVWGLYFGSPMYEREPLCNSAKKYKAAVHVHSDWGLTGGAWDSLHMGMWIGTGGLSDHWGLAHEFMHGVQSVEGGLACNSSNTCGWVYESHANWAAQQQTEYHTKEVHCSEYLPNAPHLYLGSTRDRYCNWQFMEYLKDKYCYSAVNAIWTGKAVDDPFTAIMNGQNWTLNQLNDFMGEWSMHNVTWDYQDPPPESTAGGNQGSLYRSKYGLITDRTQTWRRLRLTRLEPLDTDYAANRRFVSPFYWAPQRFGYNVVRLYPEPGAASVTVTFRGLTSASPSPDWRWGLVATDADITKPRYSTLQNGSDNQLTFCVNSGEYVWLVVMATPSTQQKIVWDQAYNTVPRYPYMIQLASAWPEGFQNGTPDACPSGLTRTSNGGGCAPSGTTAYVGPYAVVASGAKVSASATITDHAYVETGSTVSGGTVAALSMIGSAGTYGNANTFTVSGGTAKTTFFPLGWFASGQSLSGGSLVGDVEFQGANVNHSNSDCSGFVDGSSCTAPGTDKTPAPPYTWRD